MRPTGKVWLLSATGNKGVERKLIAWLINNVLRVTWGPVIRRRRRAPTAFFPGIALEANGKARGERARRALTGKASGPPNFRAPDAPSPRSCRPTGEGAM